MKVTSDLDPDYEVGTGHDLDTVTQILSVLDLY